MPPGSRKPSGKNCSMCRRLCIVMITVLASLCCWNQVQAVEVIAGKVVAVDREHKQIILDPAEEDQEQLVIMFEQGDIPYGLQAGELVRIKGEFTVVSDGLLKSQKVWCSCPARLRNDRTGVRRRLFEGRGRGFRHGRSSGFGHGRSGGRHGGR